MRGGVCQVVGWETGVVGWGGGRLWFGGVQGSRGCGAEAF